MKGTWLNQGVRVALVPASIVVSTIAACSGGTSGTGGACTNDYSGQWSLTGTCAATSCNVTQSACSASVTCNDGTKLSGTVSGTSASLSGTIKDGSAVSCSVAFGSSKDFTLQCTSTAQCSGSAHCQSGACGTPIAGSSSGSTGSTGSTGGMTSGSGMTSGGTSGSGLSSGGTSGSGMTSGGTSSGSGMTSGGTSGSGGSSGSN